MELKAGYVVELEVEGLAMVTYGGLYNEKDVLCISSPTVWFPVDCFDDNLDYTGTKVMKIYGRASNMNAHKLTISDRELLWDRDAVLKLTIEEVEKLLGYKIKIVG